MMNGAEVLIANLVANDVTACFANPGTSEMQFVAALDGEAPMRSVLCLFEGVATGAADGYGRIADKPACTLLHLGPGYGNGIANLHNARKAYTPIVNVIGDHATYHRGYDAPLNSDLATLIKPNSIWAASIDAPDDIAALTSEAVAASYGPPGGPVSLILPADTAWLPAEHRIEQTVRTGRATVEHDRVEEVARAVRGAERPVVLLGTNACRADALREAARLEAMGARVYSDTFIARHARGAGNFTPRRMPYHAEMAVAELAGTDLMIYVGTTLPVAFFAYPGRPSVLLPEGCTAVTLADRREDAVAALRDLADALGAPLEGPVQLFDVADAAPTGGLNPFHAGISIARHMPENAIICDDAVTSGAGVGAGTATARPFDSLALTGGSIGIGLPMAVGAAVAAPDRKVISLNGDGAAMYTLQALWTMARESLDVTVVVFANYGYRILGMEMERTGAGPAGPAASRLLDLGDPKVDWVSIARGMGVPAVSCATIVAASIPWAR
jgi:acetolactate synthase I/II/III large subunit